MKKILATITIVILAVISYKVNAQEGKYGADSATCVMNISLFNEYFKQKNYSDAMEPWRWVFNNCPKGTKRTYLYGEKMFKQLIRETTDEETKSALVDTLMMIYDQRMRYYNEEGYVLGKKGVSLYGYYPNRKEEVSQILEAAVKKEGLETGPVVIYRYFQVNTELYKAGQRTKEEILDIYDRCSEIVDANMEGKDSANYAKAQKNLETFFGPFASCEDLVEIYGPKLKATPDDVALLRKITNLFGKKGCHDADVYLEASERLYVLEPFSKSAANLARLYAGKGMSTKVSKYFSEAIELEEDKNKKARYLIELSDFSYRILKDYPQAKKYATRAAAANPGWGRPWIQLGDIYVAGASTCGDDFEATTVYWAAVDMYTKAKTIDGTFASEANSKIATYSKYFPKQEDVFFRGMKPGESYKVECWINETTSVRVK